MIRLHSDALRRGYPAMSVDFAARMDHLLHGLPERKEKPMKRTLRAAIIAAIALALLSSAALALTRPAILNWLLSHNAPASPQLENSVQAIHSAATADNITVRLTGLVYDGMQLAFSYEVENAAPSQPALVLLSNDMTVDGQPVGIPHYVSNGGDARLVPSPHLDVLPVQRNPFSSGGWSNTISTPLTGGVSGMAYFDVYRPEKAIAVLIPADSDFYDERIDDQYRAELDDALATLRSFPDVLLIDGSEEDAEAWAAQGYTVLGRSGRPLFPVDDPRCHVVRTARIAVPFTFSADNAFSFDFSGTTFIQPEGTILVKQFLLTPLVTRINVELHPAGNTEAAARALAETLGTFTLTGDSDQPVVYSEMDSMYSMRPSVVCKDGQWFVRYWEELPGLQEFPQSIGFTVSTGELLRFDLPIPE